MTHRPSLSSAIADVWLCLPQALLAASLHEPTSRDEAVRADGLISGHAYSLIRVVETAAGFRMLRLRKYSIRDDPNSAIRQPDPCYP